MIAKNENIVGRRVHDTFFLIDISENYANDKCTLFEVNDVGEFIWNQLDALANLPDIVDAIVERITDDVERSAISDDVTEFIHTLIQLNFVEEC
jgi:hypothetical protein